MSSQKKPKKPVFLWDYMRNKGMGNPLKPLLAKLDRNNPSALQKKLDATRLKGQIKEEERRIRE